MGIENLKNRFFGRDRLLREICQGVLAAQPASFSLVGSKLLGKSQILNHLAAPNGPLCDPELADWRPPAFQEGGRVIVAKIDCDAQEAQEDLLNFLHQRLLQQLRQEARLPLDWRAVENQPSVGRQIWQIARQINDMAYRLVVLFDNFDSVFQRQLISMDAVDELRPLTLELAMVVATEQPLHDLDRELAASPLFNVMTQLFINLLEPDAARAWLEGYAESYPVIGQMIDELLVMTGQHPYLLHRIGDILLEIGQMLPLDQATAEDVRPLIRLRLAEHGRLLFVTLRRKLQQPPARVAQETVQRLIEQLREQPLPMNQIGRDNFAAANWLINQAIVSYSPAGYRLFSPLFADFLAARTQPAETPQPRSAPAVRPTIESDIYQQLTKIEAALLHYLVEHSNTVIPPEELLAKVWRRPNATTRRVQEAIRRLRQQLEDVSPPIGAIENDRGRGYRFVPTQS
ncbi:MAG: helix-turn-helix domain-containing protein [Caldilineaceae bacterium]